MAFIGRNSSIAKEDFSKGMDGVSSVNSIANGYVIEAQNVDLSQPGRVQKRAGYHVYGQRLPLRTKQIEVSGTQRRLVFDIVPDRTITISLFSNTSLNATATSDAMYFRTNDAGNTIFATFSSTEVVTKDTVISALCDDGLTRYVQPIEVFSATGTVQILLPQYVKNWWVGVTLSDTSATIKSVNVSSGYYLKRVSERDITGLSVAQTAPFRVRVTFSSDSPAANVRLGASVLFETCVRKTNGDAVCGTVVGVASEYIDLECETADALLGAQDQNYFQMRYINAKHLRYKSANYEFDIVNSAHALNSANWYLRINDACSVSLNTSILSGTIPSTTTREIGFVYGLATDAGPVTALSKYFDVANSSDKILCGVDGYLFAETAHPRTTIPTIASLRYVGATTLLTANITQNTFAIPLTGADAVYAVGDTVYVEYAEGTYSDQSDAYGIIQRTFTVVQVSNTTLYVDAGDDKKLSLRANTQWRFTRKSSRIYLRDAASYKPITPGMTLQYAVANKLLPVYEIKDVDYTGSRQFIDVDQELEWGSDESIVPMPLFSPVSSDVSCTFAEKQGERVDVNCVTIDRSTVIAAGDSGMWRFNGAQVLNMRIPRPASGYIRNIPTIGGTLKLDTQEDGTKTGRRYDFIVTYSYSELVSGKLITYESGLNPVSTYTIVSEQAPSGVNISKPVELQVPTIPRGIGLPADDIFINVYRTKSGTLTTQPSAEAYLLERTVPNDPDSAFVTIIAGTESTFVFNAENYKVLYKSLSNNESETDELQREIVDPPLTSIVSTLENRIMAASGYEHPYLHFICKDVYSTVDNSFKAHYEIKYAPQQVGETAYRFMSCPVTTSTTSSTGGAKDGAFGGTGINFQCIGVDSYEIKKITYTDNSHLFKITGATITADKQYVLRLAAGVRESLNPGTADPYYNGYSIETQMFTGTSTAQQVSGPKKWTRANPPTVVSPPTELVLVFEKVADVTPISTTNGLVIIGNTTKDAVGAVEFLLYTTASITTNDYIILKGLGTTGQVRDAAGKQLSFDNDLVMKVMNGASPFTLKPLIKGTTYATHFAEPSIKSAISVSNASTGVICEPFSIFKLQSTTARATTDWSISPKTATVQLTTSPSISPTAGDYVCIDGLPSEVPPNSGFRYNGSLEIVSFSTDTFTVKVSPPETARGTLTQDFTSALIKGKLVWTKGSVTENSNKIRLRLKNTTLTVPLAAGDWVYLITKGVDSDSTTLALTGWFKVSSVSANSSTWVSTLTAGQQLQMIEIHYYQTLDFASLTAMSESRLLIAGREGNGTSTQLTINVPVPCLATKDGSQDITGILYSTIDGYLPLERVIRPLSHAMNCVLHDVGFTYWGGKAIGNVENTHPNNVLPTNGLKYMPHLNPDDAYRYRYYEGSIVSAIKEPKWICTMQPFCWRVEGNVQADVSGNVYTPAEFYTLKEFRPARLWYTNPTGTVSGQAFRELSFTDVESQDGERITGLAQFQTYSLLAKQNSLYRLSFGGSDKLDNPQKVPGSTGAVCHKNMVPTDRGVFFLHDTGVYVSDGSVCETIHQVKRLFDDRVVQNRLLFPLTSGFHDTLGKTIYVGVPLSTDEQSLSSDTNSQFVFNYSLKSITLDSVMSGWSYNTSVPAIAWVGVYNDVFFSSTNGIVCRMRTEKSSTKFSDERNAITMSIKTRYMFADDNFNCRFLRNLIFQFGKETGINMTVSMAWDFLKGYTTVNEYVLPADGFGIAPFGQTYFGCDKFMENIRKVPQTNRVSQVSLQFVDSTLDSSGEIYGVFVESTETSTEIVGQGVSR